MSDGTVNTRNKVSGALQRMTPRQARAAGDAYEIVPDDAKPLGFTPIPAEAINAQSTEEPVIDPEPIGEPVDEADGSSTQKGKK